MKNESLEQIEEKPKIRIPISPSKLSNGIIERLNRAKRGRQELQEKYGH